MVSQDEQVFKILVIFPINSPFSKVQINSVLMVAVLMVFLVPFNLKGHPAVVQQPTQ